MASLMAQRSSVAAFSRQRAAPKVASRAVARRSAVVVRAQADKPLVGSAAPDFKAQAVYDQEFMEVQLSKYRGKYVVLFFYPLDFTFGKHGNRVQAKKGIDPCSRPAAAASVIAVPEDRLDAAILTRDWLHFLLQCAPPRSLPSLTATRSSRS